MKTSRRNHFFLLIFTLMTSLTLCNSVMAEDESNDVVPRLKASKHKLIDGIGQAEKGNGTAISAKFEVEDGKLLLSVYAAKEGRNKDAEHNTLIELNGDATTAQWTPEIEVFADKEHLTRAAMQLTVAQLSKRSLGEVVATAIATQPGEVYSVIPAIKNDNAIFVVKIAKADGKSVELNIDAKTAQVTK